MLVSRNAGLAAVAALLSSCAESSPSPTPPAVIELVSGNGQMGFAGEELPSAVVVRVKDASGAVVVGQIINFRVTAGGGSVFAGSAISDSSGTARERWTLGPVTGLSPVPQRLESRAVDSQTGAAIVFSTFEATAVARPPTGLAYSASPPTYVLGTAIAPNAPSSGGGPVIVYSISPELPPGLVMSASTGVITGTPTAVAAAANYTVTATNSGGSTTASLSITVNPPSGPVITAQPASQAVFGMGTATFTVAATGTGPLSYQWQKNGVPVAGAGSATYAVTPQSPADTGSVFTVAVSDTFGGSTISAAAVLTVLPGFWPTGSLARVRSDHTATLLLSGKVLIVGGHGNYNSEILASAELYDPDAGSFTATGSPAKGRYWHTATLLPSGKVLIAGGVMPYGAAGAGTSAELYDPDTGTFTATGSMAPPGRASHTATLLPNGKVLVAGGNFGGAPEELFDPAAGTFTATGWLKYTRADHTATLLPSGKVLLAGGHGNGTLASTELYDPTAGTFTATGSLATERNSHTATLLSTGKVLIAGGWPNIALGSAEMYEPAAGTFTPAASLATGRGYHTATPMPGGKVLVVGGYGPGPIIPAGAELYDPAEGTFAAAGNLAKGRYRHTATLLQSGKVLVVGGCEGDGTVSLASAELYEP